jgi:hypothetical protein
LRKSAGQNHNRDSVGNVGDCPTDSPKSGDGGGNLVAAGWHQALLKNATNPVSAMTRFSPLLAILIAAACSGDAASISGDSATFQLFLEHAGGISSRVQLVAKGLPSGVTATFTPAAASGASSVVTLVLAASGAAPESHATVAIDVDDTTIKSRGAAIRLWIGAPSSRSLKPHASSWRAAKSGG